MHEKSRFAKLYPTKVSLYRVYIAILACYDSCDTMYNQCSYVHVIIASYVGILPVGLDYFDHTYIFFPISFWLIVITMLKRNQLAIYAVSRFIW